MSLTPSSENLVTNLSFIYSGIIYWIPVYVCQALGLVLKDTQTKDTAILKSSIVFLDIKTTK